LNAGSASDVPDLRGLAARHGRGNTTEDALRFFCELLLGRQHDPAASETVPRVGAAGGGSESERFNRTIAALLARPIAQLT
jgi:hypothetical protein